jgi:hypothetical protein
MKKRRFIALTVGFGLALAGSLAAADEMDLVAAVGGPKGARPPDSQHADSGQRTVQTATPAQPDEPGAATAHPVVVVELFTSQGCSSCPPADAVLSQLVNRPGVIPLALHVDYWDYIGWTDKFGSPDNTARQKAYAHAAGSRTIYTPQLIIEGDDRVEGPRPLDVAELIQEHHAETTPVELTLVRDGDSVKIDASSSQTFGQKVLLELVRYLPEQTVEIERGENAGKTITYRNIVTAWQTVATWDGAQPISLLAQAQGNQAVVVIVQKPGPGEILAAAALR